MVRLTVKDQLDEHDLKLISDLVARSHAAIGFAPLSDVTMNDLASPHRPEMVSIWIADSTDGLVAYAHLRHGADRWTLEWVLDPAHQPVSQETVKMMVSAALEQVQLSGDGLVEWWSVLEPEPFRPGDLGFLAERELLIMRYDLQASADLAREAAPTRAFEIGHDESAWLAVNNEAFASHPDQGHWTLETLHERTAAPWFNPTDLLLHEVNGRLLGFCWTKIDPTEHGIGEIYVLGVAPFAQGRGLGHQLLFAGLAHLAAAGLATAVLYVDASDERAVRLYQGAGFHTTRTIRSYLHTVENPL